MIFINKRSTRRSGFDVPCRGMCSHAAGLNHKSANDAARPEGKPVFPLPLGTRSSAARTERQFHAALGPSLVPWAAGWDLRELSLLSCKVWDQATCQSLENNVCGYDSA